VLLRTTPKQWPRSSCPTDRLHVATQDAPAADADEAVLTVEQKLLADAERLAASIQVRQDG
jgi:hypothetical protein